MDVWSARMLYATFMPGTLDGPGSGGTNDYEITGN